MMTFEEYCNPEPRYAIERNAPYGWTVYDTEYDEDCGSFANYQEAVACCDSLNDNDNDNEARGVRQMERALEDPPIDWRYAAVEAQRLKR